MGWLSQWWRNAKVPPVTLEEKLKLMLQTGLTPCLSIKTRYDSTPVHFLITGLSNGEIGGIGIGHLTELSYGTRMFPIHDIDTVDWADPAEVFGKIDVDPGFKASIEELAHYLPYDKRVKVFTNAAGVHFYVKGGFNHNHYGFTVEVPCKAEWCERGYIAGFVHYTAAPYYQGKWVTTYLSEDLPDFVYYDWMGEKLSAARLIEKHEREKADIHKRWAAYQVQRKALDNELNEILKMLKKHDLHIEL